MLCEYAYYKTHDKYEKPFCNNKAYLEDRNDDACYLIYYCPVSERFENTEAMFRCKYRKGEGNDGQ